MIILDSLMSIKGISVASFIEAKEKALFSKTKQVEFLKDLNSLLPYVGAPLKIFEHMSKFSTGGTQLAAKSIATSLRRGKGISHGMDGWFDDLLIQAVRVGEEQGVLHKVLSKVLDTFESQSSSLLTALKLMVYPVVLGTVVIIAFNAIREKVFPVFLKLVKNDPSKLPSEVQDAWAISDLITNYGFLSVIIFALLYVGIVYFLKTYTGQYRSKIDQSPVIRIYPLLQGAKFMQSYAILKAINVSEHDIISQLSKNASPYMRSHYTRMHRKLNSGEISIANVIDTGLISKSQVERLRLLSGSTDYAQAVELASNAVYSGVNDLTIRLFKSIRFFLMIIIGYALVVLFLAVMSADQLSS